MRRKLIILLLSIFLFCFALNSWYKIGIANNLNLKSSYVAIDSINANVLFHGPCEPLYTIDSKYMDSLLHKKVYNLGMDHSDFADNYLSLYLYLQNNKTPECVYLYVTPESFDESVNTFHTYRYVPFSDDSLVASVINDCDSSYRGWSHLPLLKYTYFSNRSTFLALQGWKHLLTGKSEPYFPDGYIPYESPSPRFMSEEDTIKSFKPKGDFTWSVNREKYFIKTLELAQQRKMKMVIYESPSLSEVVEWSSNRLEFLQKIRKIGRKHGVEYWIFDYADLSLSSSNFISPQITNIKASRVFMDILYEKIKEIHK